MRTLKPILTFLRPFVDRMPLLANGYRRWRDRRLLHQTPVMTPFGFRLVGHAEMQAGRFEPAETVLIRELLAATDILLNVGANIGYYCCHARQLGRTVLAFEPMPTNLEYLRRNLAANRWSEDVEIFPLAASNRSGEIEIFGGATGASLIQGWAGTPAHYVTRVQCATLDDTVADRLAGRRVLVVMDIEGAELWALQGARRLLRSRPQPVWVVEISVGEHQPAGCIVNPHLAATFAIFWDLGYEAWTATATPRRVTPAEVAAIAGGGPDTLGTHNFLFRPSPVA
ncbi:hypothetical protein Verru16b_03545 [Lacunisphaera limnophila]|uniref:Methyltransferase FkbM domain-containing protein n=1 Tax=Lacunisphaera limnophila TaxID=1838286 RepID=A0A1D8AZX1_9BACT|nr:FkbM family methyltransferase [Lacunisphaera limnophila]AOS46439.1 hypothetical protein Verru16b_03545 [Lacunisphaera limnophila]